MQKMNTVTCDPNGEYSLTFGLELPWPARALSPNARGHWSALARAKKSYRARCRAIAAAAWPRLPEHLVGGTTVRIDVGLLFVPPDRRVRDLDNLVASMKAGLDGVADALGVDDSRWRLRIEMAQQTAPGGVVLVSVGVAA